MCKYYTQRSKDTPQVASNFLDLFVFITVYFGLSAVCATDNIFKAM